MGPWPTGGKLPEVVHSKALLSRSRRVSGLFAKLPAVLLGLAIVSTVPAIAAEAPPIFVGGQFIRQHAVDDGAGHVLVPIRGVFEALGASVVYTPPRIVVVRKNEAVIAGLVVGRRTAVVANRRQYLDVAPIRLGGRIYVPLRGIAEIAGATVRYSSQPRLVDIRIPQNDLAARVPVPREPVVPPDPELPLWAYIAIGALVLMFLLELGRRLVGSTPRNLRVGVVTGSPQRPYTVDSGDQHGIGKMAK